MSTEAMAAIEEKQLDSKGSALAGNWYCMGDHSLEENAFHFASSNTTLCLRRWSCVRLTTIKIIAKDSVITNRLTVLLNLLACCMSAFLPPPRSVSSLH